MSDEITQQLSADKLSLDVAEELWGSKAAYTSLFEAMRLLHRFARQTDALPGEDIFDWAKRQHFEFAMAHNRKGPGDHP